MKNGRLNINETALKFRIGGDWQGTIELQAHDQTSEVGLIAKALLHVRKRGAVAQPLGTRDPAVRSR